MADSADLATGMRLLDDIKRRGFTFRRVSPGPDGPLEGIRETQGWRDVVHLGGFSHGCYAWRERRTSLLLPAPAAVPLTCSPRYSAGPNCPPNSSETTPVRRP